MKKKTPMSENIYYDSCLSHSMKNPLAVFSVSAVSIICHVALLLAFFFVSRHVSSQKESFSVINVSMVAFPTQQQSSKSENHPVFNDAKPIKTSDKVAVYKAPSEPIIEAKKAKKTESAKIVNIPSKSIKKKISLKKTTFQPSKIVKNVVQQLEEQLEQSRPSPLEREISRLQDEVKQPHAVKNEKGQSSKSTGYGGQHSEKQMAIYGEQVKYYVEKHWAFSNQMTSDSTDLETILVVKIMPNGSIADLWFEKKSGNKYLDESVYKAVKKSNPLPPLPKEYPDPFLILGLIATPSGFK